MGKKLLQWPIELLKKINLEGIVVVSKGLDLSQVDPCGLDVVRNERSEFGISESVKIAIERAKDHEGVLLFLGDMPRIDERLVEEVIKRADQRIVFPIHGKIKGFPVFLPARFFDEALRINGDVGLKGFIKDHPEDVVIFEGGKGCIFDVDRPEDLAKR